MAQQTERPFHVIIIGAGITGLITAQGLKKAGISFEIFERETAEEYLTRPRDWGMLLHWGTQHILACLPEELHGRLQEARCNKYLDFTPGENDFLPCYNGETGELLYRIHSDNPVRVSRRKMRNLFKEGINIQFDKRLADIDFNGPSVRTTFTDGTTCDGSIVIGCDGSRSAVRSILVGPEATQLTKTPVTLMNLTETYTAEQAHHLQQLHPMFKIAYYPGTGEAFWLSVQDVPDPSRPENWRFQMVYSWSHNPLPEETTAAERLRYFKEKTSKFVEPWRSAAAWVKDDTQIPAEPCITWNVVPWDNHKGMATLAGDAAHPVTPHRGQGLNLALEDVANFVEAMKTAARGGLDLRSLIDAYDEGVRARGSKEAQLSLEQTLKSHDWNMLLNAPIRKTGMYKQANGSV